MSAIHSVPAALQAAANQYVTSDEEILSQISDKLGKYGVNPQVLFENVSKDYSLLDNIFDLILSKISLCMLESYKSYMEDNFDYKMGEKQKITWAIFKDFDPPYKEDSSQFKLNNESLISMMEEAQIELKDENLSCFYNFAIKCNHPLIFAPAQEPMKSTDVDINLLWIQRNPFSSSQSMLDNNDETINLEKYLNKIFEISKVRPQAKIILWVDTALVTEEVFNKTIEKIRSFKGETGVNLKLADVRKLEIEPELMECFNPSMPVYFRVDLLKALIPFVAMQNPDHPKFCEVRDLDIKPNTVDQVLNKNSLAFLEKYGFVFATYVGVGHPYENSFMIFDVKNRSYEAAYKHFIFNSIITDVLFQKTTSAEEDFGQRRSFSSKTRMDGEKVFSYYANFFDKTCGYVRKPTVCVEAPLSTHSAVSRDYKNMSPINETSRFSKEGKIVIEFSDRSNLSKFDFSSLELVPHDIPEDLLYF